MGNRENQKEEDEYKPTKRSTQVDENKPICDEETKEKENSQKTGIDETEEEKETNEMNNLENQKKKMNTNLPKKALKSMKICRYAMKKPRKRKMVENKHWRNRKRKDR